MMFPARRWLSIVFAATVLIFTAVLLYVYAFRFFAWLESDAAVPALLAQKTVHTWSPVVDDWYYANGELWVVAPHLLAVLSVAIFGLGPPSLLVAVALGFALEIAVLVKLYSRLAGEAWIAVFATMVTLMAWSNAHVAYGYIQLAYSFAVCLYLVTFHVFGGLMRDPSARPWRFALAGLLVAAIAVQSPTRGLVYLTLPIVAGCLWPWRAIPLRRRFAVAAAAVTGGLVAHAIYKWWLVGIVAWSQPRGHLDFEIGGAKQIAGNIRTLIQGLAILCAGGGAAVWAIPGAVVLAGALALVVREALARALGPLRWMSVVVLAQLGGVLVPGVLGSLLDSPVATRYLIPSLISIMGLAVVIAVRTACADEPRWWRRFATGWLVAVPVAALVAARDARPPEVVAYVWPDAAELELVADELVRRRLTHGFAGNLAANLLTLDSRGAALTCRTSAYDVLLPERWLAPTSCYDASVLPDRFFVVAYQNDSDRRAVRATLPPAIDQFRVGDTYEVQIFRTEAASTAWLALPIPDGDRTVFPVRLPVTHLQLRRHQAAYEAGDLVATGEPGTVIYGPYIELPPGDYTATWIGSGIDSPGKISFSVKGSPRGRERRTLARTIHLDARALPRGRAELVQIAFKAKRTVMAVDFPIKSSDGGRVAVHELVITRNAR